MPAMKPLPIAAISIGAFALGCLFDRFVLPPKEIVLKLPPRSSETMQEEKDHVEEQNREIELLKQQRADLEAERKSISH